MQRWQYIFIAMILGVATGLLVQYNPVLSPVIDLLKPLGDIFIRLIKMVVVPLIFFSLVSAITTIDDMKVAGRIGTKSALLYLITTMLAISLSLGAAAFLEIGNNAHIEFSSADQNPSIERPTPPPSWDEMLVQLVPTNPIAAMVEGNILQVIIFAILWGASINLIGQRASGLTDVMEAATHVTYELTAIIMKLAPIGVFGIMAWLAGTQKIEALTDLLVIVIVVYTACFLHAIIVYSGLLMILARVSPIPLFKKITNVQLFAYTSSSSSATLPLTMKTAQEKLGVSKTTSSFTLPLGTTINMDGTALYQGVCAVFVAQVLGIELVMSDYMTIVLTATLASIGSAGIPGAGLIMFSLVLASVGLPLEAVAIIASVDRILDMARTVVNVTGDLTIAVIVDKLEGKLDEEHYHA